MLYFNAAIDSEWNTLGNWWNDAVFTDPALALPTAGDDLEIWQPVLTFDSNVGFPYASTVTVQTTGYLSQAICNLIGGTLPYGISFLGVSGWILSPAPAIADTYYVAGRPSSLPQSGTGYWMYFGYYIAGVLTQLPESGTGYDYALGFYFIAGVSTAGALDGAGTGFYDGHAYLNGTAQPTGWNSLFWYIDDVQTTLDQDGNGTEGNLNYFGGVSAGVPGTDARWLLWNNNDSTGNWEEPTNWTIYSNVEWSGNYALAAAAPTAVDNCQTPDYTQPVSQLSSSACGNIKVEYNGNYWGFNSVSGGPLTVSGTATVIGTNNIPMTGAGTANFTGSSKNIADITFGAINFLDTSSNAADPNGWAVLYGVCNVASFYDNATNAGGDSGVGLYIITYSVVSPYGYYCGVVQGASSFHNDSINYGGCLGVATFYDNAKNMLGLNGGVVLAYGKGINGTGILGTL